MIENFESNGRSFRGYLSLPTSGKGTGILLLHAWWGLNQFAIQTCDMLAQAGFVTLAPDYYAGEVASSIDEAKSCRQKLDRKSTNKLVSLAVDYLSTRFFLSSMHIGVIGFSLGAGFAIEAARSRNQVVKAVVLFYGIGGGKFDKTQAAFLGHFAENDRWGAHSKKVNALADRIRSAGQEAKFYTYGDTEHWFVETDRPEYKKDAAELAWGRTIGFIREVLEGILE
jgi:carboxymethylenebutenolidase